MELLASFQYGVRSSSFESEGFVFAHVRAICRAADACQIGKERVLSARLSVHIQYEGFATEQALLSALHTGNILLKFCASDVILVVHHERG